MVPAPTFTRLPTSESPRYERWLALEPAPRRLALTSTKFPTCTSSARRSPGGGRACWKLRRGQGEPPRRRLQGQPPLVPRRLRGRQPRERGGWNHHLQLRRRREAPYRDRGRLLHRLGRDAGGAGAHRARLLYRRRLDHQQGHAAGTAHPGARPAGVDPVLETTAKERLRSCAASSARQRVATSSRSSSKACAGLSTAATTPAA